MAAKRRDAEGKLSVGPTWESIVERQIQHMIRLVDDLLDVSRITRGKIHLSIRGNEYDEISFVGVHQDRFDDLPAFDVNCLSGLHGGDGSVVMNDSHSVVTSMK